MESPAMHLARSQMRRLHRLAEPDAMAPLIAAVPVDPKSEAAVVGEGTTLIEALRKGQASGWVNRFMAEYRMDSDEGLALLSMAEAFLRACPIPRPPTC